jgi:hypothetical protein
MVVFYVYGNLFTRFDPEGSYSHNTYIEIAIAIWLPVSWGSRWQLEVCYWPSMDVKN